FLSKKVIQVADIAMIAISLHQVAKMPVVPAGGSPKPPTILGTLPGGAAVGSVSLPSLARALEAIRKLVATGALDGALIGGIGSLAANVPTQTQSQECAWNSSYVPKYLWPPNGPRGNYPVTYVDWCDASAYCKWAGMRLCGNVNGGPLDPADATSPNADAWYNACSNGGVLTYPYGNSFNTEACGGMFAQDAVAVKGNAGCEGGVDNVFDLSGNVAEWEDACNMTTGPDDMCLVRGGSYDSFQPAKFACTAAEPMKRSAAYNDVGFRCCSN
ncbi:MAG TPA: SUMF1/EgtB/PvdO family nonheme iron enzyme, partial [Polyangiaceae bacterium]|nr:SUMF1/EgtB/PvdO family nonheme iron enzyme [Polyangiaceae bacterium]